MEHIDRVCAVICRVGGLTELGPDTDFYEAGFTSVRSLDLLLELETEWGIAIPDDRFITARSARALAEVVRDLEGTR